MTITNSMQYVRLGKSGMKISKIILGCMSYGSSRWQSWVLDEKDAIEHIKVAYDLGINAFDTANVYSNGLSEVILGKAIKQYNLPRDEIVVMTKVFGLLNHTPEAPMPVGPPDELYRKRYVNQSGLSRKHIFESVKHSLERLQLGYIDLLQCHRFDVETPIEETMQALHDVVEAGYVRYIGMSSCWAWQFAKMQAYAKQNNITEFISMQNFRNATYREEEREMIPLLQDMGVGMIPWSPLARGFLARPIKDQQTARTAGDALFAVRTGDNILKSEPFLVTINERVEEIAKKRGVSMAQVAIAWSLAKPYMSAPIIGTTSLDKLKDCVAAVQLKLTEEEVKYIDEPYKPRAISGHA